MKYKLDTKSLCLDLRRVEGSIMSKRDFIRIYFQVCFVKNIKCTDLAPDEPLLREKCRANWFIGVIGTHLTSQVVQPVLSSRITPKLGIALHFPHYPHFPPSFHIWSHISVDKILKKMWIKGWPWWPWPQESGAAPSPSTREPADEETTRCPGPL